MISSRLVRRFSPGFLGLLGTALVIYVVVAAMQRSAHIDPHGYLIGNPAPPLPWLDPPIAFLVAVTLGIVGTTLAALQVYRSYCLMEECNPSAGCCLMGYLTATGP